MELALAFAVLALLVALLAASGHQVAALLVGGLALVVFVNVVFAS